MSILIVISAPSGAGKTSVVHYLLKEIPTLSFSISACTRDKRIKEIDKKDYYFFSEEKFRNKINEGAFLEWEEVYPNQYYGTLKSEVKRIWNLGKHVIFDVDVKGGINIKNQYKEDCLSIFIMPPSISVLKERLEKRDTDSTESISKRIEKAKQEIKQNSDFDYVVINDELVVACEKIKELIMNFIEK